MPVVNMRDALAKAAAADAVDGSEHQLALDFSHRHASELRYCALWGKWLLWDEARWKPEPTLMAYDLARAVAHDYARRARRWALGAPGARPGGQLAGLNHVGALASGEPPSRSTTILSPAISLSHSSGVKR
jgi:hypothetical protein